MLSTKRAFNVWAPVGLGLFLLALGFWTGGGPVYGQASQEAPSITRDEINVVARQLWCPLCSGVRLDACDLKACAQMRDVIAIKLSEGEDFESIKSYFLDQYGPQVLGEPPRQGFNWLAWIFPFLIVVGGGVLVWNRARQMMNTPSSELYVEGVGAQTDNAMVKPGETDDDMYDRRLEEELAKHG